MNRDIPGFHANLHAWYARHGRHDLPWRNTSDPYAIYVSEIMLQQTQVQTVLTRFYPQFLDRFPTIDALAKADLQNVLKSWQGLGYYSRAVNLHKAAQMAASALPDTVEGLLALPGIGRNTAHAVAAFAFHLPVAVMEANVKRVLCRIFAIEQPTDVFLWKKAAELLDESKPFDYNQAMMDIGSMVCTKTRPACAICPALTICEGKISPENYPAAKMKRVNPIRRQRIIVLMDEDTRIHATPRTSRFLHGLYHFNNVDINDEIFEYQGITYPLDSLQALSSITQVYSHFTLNAEVYLLKLQNRECDNWYTLAELSALPWSQAELKVLELIKAIP